MRRDPHYRKIIQGLEGPLDGTHFERCAVDLLTEVYPTLTPVSGGNDAGIDGVIDEDTFLVVTTGEDILRNLTNSLDRQLDTGGERRRVVLATSRAITPPEWRKLASRAVEKDFSLINVHAREDFAARLYRNSRWARDLLGITGDPPSLSSLPSGRLLLREDLPLIGRDADLLWLRETSGDRVLVGQPGSGKTHLLLALVREDRALFLASHDETKIANDLRDLQPDLVLVDDAHVDPERLRQLCRLRQETGASFEIIATAWPGYQNYVSSGLGQISPANIRVLEGLTRSEIAQILRTIGVRTPDDDPWFRFMIDQARNRPGLAVLLGTLWLRGEGREVLSGKALSRNLIPALREVLYSDPIRLLACFALGGEAGMRLETVAEYLGIGLDRAHALAAGAAHGGILEAIERGQLAVQPAALRSALLADVFFTAPGLDYRSLLSDAVEPSIAIEAILAAAYAGANVSSDELRRLVSERGSESSWRSLATLDEPNGRWVLKHYPGALVDIAPAALHTAPGEAIQCLLRETRPVDEPLHSRPRHPLRLLQDWIQEIPFRPGRDDVAAGESLRRREQLVEQVERFLADEGNPEIALRAGLLALSPVLESNRTSYTGATESFRRGHLPASAAPKILGLWRRLKSRLGCLTPPVWRALEEVLNEWTYPWLPGVDLGDEAKAEFRSVAACVIRDLEQLDTTSPAFAAALTRWARRTGNDLSLTIDQDLAVLYPSRDHFTPDNWQQEEERQVQAARRRASEWSEKEPEVAIARLNWLQREAQQFGLQEGAALFVFVRTLAAEIRRAEDWLRAAIKYELEPRLSGYLLSRVVEEQRPGWETLLGDCLRSEKYAWLAADEAIRAHDLSSDLLEQALVTVPPNLVELACVRNQVSVPVLKRLLLHPNREVAEAAAAGIWAADPEGQVPAEVAPHWRAVVLAAGRGGGIDRQQSNYWLKWVLSNRSELALAWLRQRLIDVGDLEMVSDDGVYAAAISSLNIDTRAQLVDELRATYFCSELIPPLVGSSRHVYRSLLTRRDLVDHHLDPLAGRVPDAKWAELAEVALDAGYPPEQVASAAFWPPMTIAGFGEEHWQLWLDAFEELRRTDGGPLTGVAERGRVRAQELIAEAAAERRRFEMTGQF